MIELDYYWGRRPPFKGREQYLYRCPKRGAMLRGFQAYELFKWWDPFEEEEGETRAKGQRSMKF